MQPCCFPHPHSQPIPNSPDTAIVDLILITHGHFDHVGDAVEIAGKTGAKLRVMKVGETLSF